ncbi:glycine receptor subunit alpha-3-like [Panulirus ornatus]|uniref:glycine receptor subunit alpha-3-like n=1 Tax=Panulirus ornatus TaxID=150431 RepID=UPI003A83E975
MSVPRSNEENERLFEELKPFLSACNPKTKWKLWLGITDEADEGAWVDIETQRPLEYTNFRPPFPNGGTLYSCGMMTDEGIWADSNCKAKRCGACQVMRSSILYLRGLCFETEHRTHFRWFGYAGGRPLFRGFYNYVIMWDEDKELWLLRHAETNETLAWLENTEGYPLGRHKWSSNGSLCDESLPNSLHLSLSLCTEEQFACASGHCLDNHSRCNLFHDCEDGSDEENCSVVGVRAGYQKHLPPRGHHDSPLEITPGITLTRISDVDGISMVINLEFLLLLTWRDERVSFRHLDRSTKTLIPKRDSEQLWRPRSQAMNLLAGEIKLLDETFTVGPASNATLPNFNSVERDLVYPGTHNDITLSTHSAAKFTCSFDLYFYPFDVQECSIDLHLLDDFEGSVRFAEGGGTASYTGPKDLALYTVRNVHLDSDDERNLLRLKFELQRRLGVILLSTFVPSVLLLSVSWATLFVKLEALNVRAIMSLTTLLVLYTLFSNLSSSVPHTAAIKLIDIWFFFIILLIFMNIMMHIFIEFVVLLPKKTHRVVPIHQSVLRAEKVMCFYRFFVFPPVFSIFNLVFWSIVFLDNKNQL